MCSCPVFPAPFAEDKKKNLIIKFPFYVRYQFLPVKLKMTFNNNNKQCWYRYTEMNSLTNCF